MSAVASIAGMVVLVASGVFVSCVTGVFIRRTRKRKRYQVILSLWRRAQEPAREGGQDNRVLRYLEDLTQALLCGSTQSLSPSVRAKRAAKTFPGSWYERHARWAGCAHVVSSAGFCEASLRMALLGCIGGCLVGLVFSVQLAVLLAGVFLLIGYILPFVSVRKAIEERSAQAELHLSEMLQIVSLGLRSGLTFDRSFALYGMYFSNAFSYACRQAYRRWTLGLSSREEALKEFASSYKSEQLSRIIESVLRSLRFGSSLVSLLEEASAQARASYRACLEERVAKAPVKMMLPTGTLILPAMLLLVLGPILIELIEGF